MAIPIIRSGQLIDRERLAESRRFFTLTMLDTNTSQLVPLDGFENPYNIDKTKILPNRDTFDLPKFFETTKEIIDHVRTKEKRPSLPLVQEYPPVDMSTLGTSVVTFRVVERCPAKMSQDGTKFVHKRFRSYNEFHREDEILVMARPLDHEIELCVWSTSNKEANENVLWLERTMIDHEFALLARGATNFEFLKRLSDGYMNTDNNKLFYRPMRFFLRYNEFQLKAVAAIKDISLELKLVDN